MPKTGLSSQFWRPATQDQGVSTFGFSWGLSPQHEGSGFVPMSLTDHSAVAWLQLCGPCAIFPHFSLPSPSLSLPTMRHFSKRSESLLGGKIMISLSVANSISFRICYLSTSCEQDEKVITEHKTSVPFENLRSGEGRHTKPTKESTGSVKSC